MWWCSIGVRFDCRFLSWMNLLWRWCHVFARWLMSLIKASLVSIVSVTYTLHVLIAMIKLLTIWLSVSVIECFSLLYSKRMQCIPMQWLDNFQYLTCFSMVENFNKWNQPLPTLDVVYFIKPLRERWVV